MIKVSYLVSYDYDMFITSVGQLYDYVDRIQVSIDKDRRTWSGNDFQIPDSFFEEVQIFDIKNKIDFYFDTFFLPHLTPMENETRQRNMSLAKLGRGWKIQIDVDEYVYDLVTITKYLNKYWFLIIFPKLTPITLRANWITLFKQIENGFLYIENEEKFPFITNIAVVTFARHNNLNRRHDSNINVIHQSWARSEEQIFIKIKNWGHRDDFDTLKYFEFWRSLNIENYEKVIDFHPLSPRVWNKLFFMPASDVADFIVKFSNNKMQVLTPLPIKKIVKYAIKKILGKE